ncbi:uncharacterized protein B0T23DRAFT_408381 [Neurospora hispaniola]|uniref:Uncharacterized protein n=1 Tax=Neurospora hispaniola TaxID=588809 RepID=A0AAJ0HYK7_9PEZI|nr:hypothetical protein B0T23DRAFT_408381 [Neurospora hispaniola]
MWHLGGTFLARSVSRSTIHAAHVIIVNHFLTLTDSKIIHLSSSPPITLLQHKSHLYIVLQQVQCSLPTTDKEEKVRQTNWTKPKTPGTSGSTYEQAAFLVQRWGRKRGAARGKHNSTRSDVWRYLKPSARSVASKKAMIVINRECNATSAGKDGRPMRREDEAGESPNGLEKRAEVNRRQVSDWLRLLLRDKREAYCYYSVFYLED